jgi:hypothetical protein
MLVEVEEIHMQEMQDHQVEQAVEVQQLAEEQERQERQILEEEGGQDMQHLLIMEQQVVQELLL